ncbi:LysR family transcriptional regulator [Microvirga guangxiensis]|uniref:DNA-binding transcriptional regulator, LysR family n=1 Tax=Microvirga guangxiensis TaxID=549386 RepID=A0A1G5JNY6_9HYPH|nr:LysR family transcriptional regulator [Microvirga guangxiensis]SCY90093.1 DNA-binding transcriptional regulator, LysR family [Microvirga guangxiensis]
MELKWLEDFCCLAEHLSFSKAASLRGVSQPAFSRRIRQLEEWMGVTLINRAIYPSELTHEGKRFLPIAVQTVQQWYYHRLALRPDPAIEQHRLTFSALHTLTVTFFPDWLQSIQKLLPPFSSHLSPDKGGIEDNIASLLDGDSDFLLTYAHASVPFQLDQTRFPYLVLGTERVLPVSRAHPEGPELDRALAHGTDMPFLSYGDFSFFGVALNKLFANRPPLKRRVVHENTISIGHKAMAIAGWGVAWLPMSLIRAELADGTLVPASSDPAWSLTIEIRLYRHSQRSRPIVDEFWKAADAQSLAPHTVMNRIVRKTSK